MGSLGASETQSVRAMIPEMWSKEDAANPSSGKDLVSKSNPDLRYTRDGGRWSVQRILLQGSRNVILGGSVDSLSLLPCLCSPWQSVN